MSAIARSPAAGTRLPSVALNDRAADGTGWGLGELREFLQDALTTPPTDVWSGSI